MAGPNERRKMKYWLLPTGKDAEALRSLVPGLENELAEAREASIRHFCWRLLWTGQNDPDLTGALETAGITIAAWLLANAKLNHGLGPAISCACLNNLYVAICAAYGIYARKVMATNDLDQPDHSAEFWSVYQLKWVHVVPQLNAEFKSTVADRHSLSYYEWSYLAKMGRFDDFEYYSETGGLPLFRGLDYFAESWRAGKFTASAAALAGNAIHIDVNVPVPIWEIWPEFVKRENTWTGERVDLGLLYPNMA
jgi:hypothetical protein